MIEILRKPSEIPNITNTDDFVNLRYAYANQNGYVKNRGSEVSATINGNNLTINSGRIVVQGVECDINANGESITIDNIITLRYYTLYLQVNLALNSSTIIVVNDTLGYPSIDEGDDLTLNTTGIANIILYKFQAQNGIISNLEKIIKPIEFSLYYREDNDGKFRIGEKIIETKELSWIGDVDIGTSTPIASFEKYKNKTFQIYLKDTLSYSSIKTNYFVEAKSDENGFFTTKILDMNSGFTGVNNLYINFIRVVLTLNKGILSGYCDKVTVNFNKEEVDKNPYHISVTEIYTID